jgi:plastocyanin
VIHRQTAAILLILLSVGASAACSGSNSPSAKESASLLASARPADTQPGTQVVQLKGSDSLKFTPAVIHVKPGLVRIVFTAAGKQSLNFTSLRLNANSGNVPAGRTVTVELMIPKAGKYPFYDAYHKEQGMTGKIIASR